MAGDLIPVLVKTLAELTTALDRGNVKAIWGTATIIYACVVNRDGATHVSEMWSVTP